MSEASSPSSNPQIGSAFADALAGVLKEQLATSHAVQVPHLGTFSVSHELSEMKMLDQNEIEMTPPRRAVTFEPEDSL